MNTMTMTMAAAANASLGENLAFLAFPAKRSAQQISNTTEELLKGISILISQLLQDMIATKTGLEFREARDKQFGRYMQIMMALGDLVSASVEPATIERLTSESLSELEADFRDGGEVFGEEIKGQAMFSAWTLRKINNLVQECNSKRVAGHLEEADLAFARQYVAHVLYARFHLDCLRMSLMTGQPLFPEPLEEISEGLRATVDAYAWVRQGLDLRHSETDELAISVAWDEEQEELLRLSTNEMFRETY